MSLWKFFRRKPLNYGQLFGDQFIEIVEEFYSNFPRNGCKCFDLVVDDATKDLIEIDWDAGFCFFKKPIRQPDTWIVASHNQEETVSLVVDQNHQLNLEVLDFESGSKEAYLVAADFSELMNIVVSVK